MKKNARLNDYNHLPAIYKLLSAFGFSGLFVLLLFATPMEWITRIMIRWDLFSLVMICMSAVTFITMRPRQIRLLAKIHDSSRTVVFIIIMISTVSSLLGIFILL